MLPRSETATSAFKIGKSDVVTIPDNDGIISNLESDKVDRNMARTRQVINLKNSRILAGQLPRELNTLTTTWFHVAYQLIRGICYQVIVRGGLPPSSALS